MFTSAELFCVCNKQDNHTKRSAVWSWSVDIPVIDALHDTLEEFSSFSDIQSVAINLPPATALQYILD